MAKILTEEEIKSLTPADITYSRPRKVGFALLDPTGIEIDRHDFYYRCAHSMRVVIEVDGHPHMFDANGVYFGEAGGDL